MDKVVIGLDCSTTSTKAVAFNRNGEIIARVQESIPLYSPQPNYYEQDSEDWWSSAVKALGKITAQINPERISAIAVSNQRETFVALDKNNNCLRPAIIWLDERCKDEVESFSKKIGKEKIHRITGKPADYAPVVYRLSWMKKHEAGLFRKIKMVCDVQTFLVWKLSGSFKTSWASADPLGLFDLKNKKWSPLILKALELDESKLPQTHQPGSILGKISSQASKLTGLTENTLIVAGGGDGQLAGLGSNVLNSQTAYLNLGTAVVAGIYSSNYITSKVFRTMCSCSEQGYYFESSLRAGTFSIDWFIKNVLKINPNIQQEIYLQLEKEAEEINLGSDGLIHLPYLCGVMNPYWDIDARSTFIGISSAHTRGHFFRSIMEGIAFEQLFAIESIEKVIGSKVNNLMTIGGGVANKLWCEILANVTGKNICLPKSSEASALGAAIVAAVGSGWYKSFHSAAKEMSGVRKIIKPNKTNHAKYQQLFTTYKEIYPALKKMKPNYYRNNLPG